MSQNKIIDTLVHRYACPSSTRLSITVMQSHIIFLAFIIHVANNRLKRTETARKESRSAGRNLDCAITRMQSERNRLRAGRTVMAAVKKVALDLLSDLLDADE